MRSDNIERIVRHKFEDDSNMSFRAVFDFAFKTFVPVLQSLVEELGEQQVLPVLKRLASESGFRAGQAEARRLSANGFADFHRRLREHNHFWEHVLTLDIVENSSRTFCVKVTECLWAKTFREIGAQEIGYLLICHPDYEYCQGFNPRISMTRGHTLMQGHDYCDHCWAWEG